MINDTIVARGFQDMTRGQAEHLFPMLENLLANNDLAWADLQAIGVGIGPGNFTGIRIAVSAARGLAVSLNIPAIGVSGFETAQKYGDPSKSDTAETTHLPGPRNVVYAQSFRNGQPTGDPWMETIQDGAPSPRMSTPDWQNKTLDTLVQKTSARCRAGAPFHRPAPLYVRQADAAPRKDAPIPILP